MTTFAPGHRVMVTRKRGHIANLIGFFGHVESTYQMPSGEPIAFVRLSGHLPTAEEGGRISLSALNGTVGFPFFLSELEHAD